MAAFWRRIAWVALADLAVERARLAVVAVALATIRAKRSAATRKGNVTKSALRQTRLRSTMLDLRSELGLPVSHGHRPDASPALASVAHAS